MGMAVCGEWSKGCQTKLVLATFFVQCQCSFLWVQSETNQTSALKTSTFTGKNQLVQVCTSSYPAGPSWPFPSQVSVGTDMQEWNQNLCSALAYVYVYMRRCVYIYMYVYNAYIIYPITCFYWMCFFLYSSAPGSYVPEIESAVRWNLQYVILCAHCHTLWRTFTASKQRSHVGFDLQTWVCNWPFLG